MDHINQILDIAAIIYITILMLYISYINWKIRDYLPFSTGDKLKFKRYRNILWTISFSIVIHLVAFSLYLGKEDKGVDCLDHITGVLFTIAHTIPYFLLYYFIRDGYNYFNPTTKESSILKRYKL